MHATFTEIDRSAKTPLVNISAGTAQEMSPDVPLRVLSISHAVLKEGSERDRYLPLSEMSDINLTVLVPNKWENFGDRKIHYLEY